MIAKQKFLYEFKCQYRLIFKTFLLCQIIILEMSLTYNIQVLLAFFFFLSYSTCFWKVQIFWPTSSLKTSKIKANQIELRKIKVVHQCYNNGSLYYKKKYFYILSTCCKSKSQWNSNFSCRRIQSHRPDLPALIRTPQNLHYL